MGITVRHVMGILCLSLLNAGTVSADAQTTRRQEDMQRRGTVPDGAELYQANCAGCHGSLSSSSKRGRSTTQIQNAIKGNIGGMGFLAKLSPAEINAIATALR